MTIMLIGIVMLISFPTVINANFDASNKTYGDLALKSGPTAFNKSLGLLNTLNETTMPDFVRPLRKSLLVIRNILDLFIFAYPLQSEKNDTFHVLRKDVNDGYTFVGNFQGFFLSIFRFILLFSFFVVIVIFFFISFFFFLKKKIWHIWE